MFAFLLLIPFGEIKINKDEYITITKCQNTTVVVIAVVSAATVESNKIVSE